MVTDLTDEQRALANYMSSLSEQAFYAEWMENLEHALWRAIVEGRPFRYGRLDITFEHIARLKALSDFCGGWIVFDGSKEETFIPLRDWQNIYDPKCGL